MAVPEPASITQRRPQAHRSPLRQQLRAGREALSTRKTSSGDIVGSQRPRFWTDQRWCQPLRRPVARAGKDARPRGWGEANHRSDRWTVALLLRLRRPDAVLAPRSSTRWTSSANSAYSPARG